jgi:hypothetical protein
LHLGHWDRGSELAILDREYEGGVRPTIASVAIEEERNQLVVLVLYVEVELRLLYVRLVIPKTY